MIGSRGSGVRGPPCRLLSRRDEGALRGGAWADGSASPRSRREWRCMDGCLDVGWDGCCDGSPREAAGGGRAGKGKKEEASRGRPPPRGGGYGEGSGEGWEEGGPGRAARGGGGFRGGGRGGKGGGRPPPAPPGREGEAIEVPASPPPEGGP